METEIENRRSQDMNPHREKVSLSVVVPVCNERENVRLLYHAIKNVLEGMEDLHEIVFVDDGSTDGTREILREVAQKDVRFRAILFRKNFGQSAALAAGFSRSRGDIVVTMDGDLQNDPEDISLLIQKIQEGYDVVSGWRKNRKDRVLARKVPSRIANCLICSVTDVRLHDTGCALKAFRREVIDRIRLYGELHRFIPSLARVEGARISEVVVHHHPRRFGRSKYNLSRAFRVLMDLFSLNLFLKYLRNPLRLFGKIGAYFLFVGLLVACAATYLLLAEKATFFDLNVLVTLVFLLFVAGFQFLFIGLIASLIVKTGERRGGTLRPYLSYQKRGKDG